jgi:hypothetical protein
MYEARVFERQLAAYSAGQPVRTRADVDPYDLYTYVQIGRIERSRMAVHLIGQAASWVRGLFKGKAKA